MTASHGLCNGSSPTPPLYPPLPHTPLHPTPQRLLAVRLPLTHSTTHRAATIASPAFMRARTQGVVVHTSER